MNRNSERDITRVLAGFRDADPPSGLEGRILRAVQERASSAPGWPRWKIVGNIQLWQWSGGFVAAAVLVGLFVLSSHRTKQDLVELRAPSSSVETVVPVARVSIPKVAHRLHESSIEQPPEAAKEQPLNDSDSLALLETRAPSQAAPEMPLTAQERSLLNIVHQRDTEELAALDPVARANRRDEEKYEYQKFFEARVGPQMAQAWNENN